MSKYYELRSLRAKRGNATIKADLLEEFRMLESMSWNLTILSIDSNSTYNGLYPEGIQAALKKHMLKLREVEEKIKNICN